MDSVANQISQEVLYKILDRVYPVGSEYRNYEDGRDPAIILGFGTWEQIEDVFILAAGPTYPIGTTGGRATTNHAYIEPGLNSGRFQDTGSNYVSSVNGDIASWISSGGGSSHSSVSYVRGKGGSVRTNGTSNIEVRHARYVSDNMPQYTTCYVWKRVA